MHENGEISVVFTSKNDKNLKFTSQFLYHYKATYLYEGIMNKEIVHDIPSLHSVCF